MYFSGKVSNSIITFLKRNCSDLEGLYELTDLPPEFLRDPTSWLDAAKVEAYLRSIEQEYGPHFPGENLIEKIGHSSPELRSWGVLDSVVRMMQKPQDIFNQPQRFISYFISPPPPLGGIERQESYISFELPMAHDEFPCVTEYLRAAMESLPTFIGGEMAMAKWEQTKLIICWAKSQENLFADQEVGHNLKPEFMQSLVATLENTEKQLEQKRQELLQKQNEIEKLQTEMTVLKLGTEQSTEAKKQWAQELAAITQGPLIKTKNQFLRMSDYFTRAQQLVTLLVAQDRMSPQVREAMRRVDWEQVQQDFGGLAKEGTSTLALINDLISNFSHINPVGRSEKLERIDTDLNALVEKAIDEVSADLKQSVQFDKLLFLDRPVSLFPDQMQQALVKILGTASRGIASRGKVRIVTRPRGGRAEIEISDTGKGFNTSELENDVGLEFSESIVKMHQGHLAVTTRAGEGSTFVIDLPV